jgi:translation initiation factor 2 beta subunit (eIF-2beta)/eIF-5
MTDTGAPEAHDLIRCPECESGQHVDIRADGRRSWTASCAACGIEWVLADPR